MRPDVTHAASLLRLIAGRLPPRDKGRHADLSENTFRKGPARRSERLSCGAATVSAGDVPVLPRAVPGILPESPKTLGKAQPQQHSAVQTMVLGAAEETALKGFFSSTHPRRDPLDIERVLARACATIL